MFKGHCNGNGNGNGYGYGQPHSSTANYHRTHSGDHVTKVAQRPCPAGGAVLQHHVVHKESFKEVDGGKHHAPPANRHCFDNYPMKQNHHGGGSGHHRYETYEETETYEESCEEETYGYGAGRHHGYGHGHGHGHGHGYGAGGGRRFEYETHEETYEDEEEEVVVGSGGCAQLRRGCA